MKIVFFGTPEFAAHILEHILHCEKHHEIVAVISKPDKPKGRDLKIIPTPVKNIANSYLPHVPLFQPRRVSTDEMTYQLQQLHPDLFVVVAYGEIIKPAILSLPTFGCINIHASLLPDYRGAAPMQRSLMDGVATTGVTIMRMDEGLDSGDILLTKSFTVSEHMNMQGLSEKMLSCSKEAISEALERIVSKCAVYTTQNHSMATFAPKILPKDLVIDLAAIESAKRLHNKIRALSPKPGAYIVVSIQGAIKRVKLLQTTLLTKENNEGSTPTTFSKMKDGKLKLSLLFDTEYELIIEQLQLEGKKAISGDEFIRGCDISTIRLV